MIMAHKMHNMNLYRTTKTETGFLFRGLGYGY